MYQSLYHPIFTGFNCLQEVAVMKKNVLRPLLVMCFIFLMVAPLWAVSPPAVGGQLPDFQLSFPKNSVDKSYLNISGSLFSSSFKIPQIGAQVVVIEIFSMYCPYCQAEAPNVNSLYQKIESNPALKGKIKLVGIGVGNSEYEVGVFKKKYNIPFVLFPDGDFKIHKLMGEVRTPYFIGVKINADRSHQVFYSKLGAFAGVDQFLNEIVALSGLQ
jgi:thiol-disulfide isomerase/thioredoxin